MEAATSRIDVRLSDKKHILFDIDGTLTPERGCDIQDLRRKLQDLREAGMSLGLATSQSALEAADFLPRKLGIPLEPRGLFNGWLILEDGHVLVAPGQDPQRGAETLVGPQTLTQMQAWRSAFETAWRPVDDEELASKGWGTLPDLPNPLVSLATSERATLSVWEKGPDVTSPEYQGEYELVMKWARQTAVRLGLDRLDFVEAGNGTLRVLERDQHKGTALLQTGLDLSQAILVGDGYNDLEAAKVVRDAGGYVVAVANAVEEFKEVAHFVTGARACLGVVEFTSHLLTEMMLHSEYLPLYRLLCSKNSAYVLEKYTLRDAIKEKYLRKLILWLLGGTPHESVVGPPDMTTSTSRLVAQTIGSPWQVAWTVIGLLDATILLGDTEIDTLVRDRLLGEEQPLASLREPDAAVPWLLWVGKGGRTGVFTKQADGESVYDWEDRYDTAVITWSLLKVAQYYGQDQRNRFWQEEIESAVKGGLRALQRHMGVEQHKEKGQRISRSPRYEEDLLLHGGEALAVTIPTLLLACQEAPEAVKNAFDMDPLQLLAYVTQDAIAFVDLSLKETTDKLVPFARQRMISALLDVLAVSEQIQVARIPPDQARHMQEIVTSYCDHLTAVASRDVEADTAIKSARLALYLKAGRVLENLTRDSNGSRANRIQVVNPQVVLGSLRSILSSITPFSGGSVYYSLDATLHTLPCLVEICYWREAEKTVIELYDKAIKDLSFPDLFTKISIAELSRRETKLDEREKELGRLHRRRLFILWGTFVFSLVAAVGLLLWNRLGGLSDWLSVMLTVFTIGTGFAAWLYNRKD